MDNGPPEETLRRAEDNLRLDYEQTCLQIRASPTFDLSFLHSCLL
jgi:hypothetical protein